MTRVLEPGTPEYEEARQQWWYALPKEAQAEYDELMRRFLVWQGRYGMGHTLVADWKKKP